MHRGLRALWRCFFMAVFQNFKKTPTNWLFWIFCCKADLLWMLAQLRVYLFPCCCDHVSRICFFPESTQAIWKKPSALQRGSWHAAVFCSTAAIFWRKLPEIMIRPFFASPAKIIQRECMRMISDIARLFVPAMKTKSNLESPSRLAHSALLRRLRCCCCWSFKICATGCVLFSTATCEFKSGACCLWWRQVWIQHR